MKRLAASVEGRVQGVGFRYSAQKKARCLSLHGWVRNTYNGHVELIVEGEAVAINKFLHWLHSGPALSRVDKVDYDISEARHDFQSFQIRP